MKKKVLSYVALSSALLTVAPLAAGVVAHAAPTSSTSSATTTSTSTNTNSSSSNTSSATSDSASNSSASSVSSSSSTASSNSSSNNSSSSSSSTSSNKDQTNLTSQEVSKAIKADDAKVSDLNSEDQAGLINAVNTNTTVVSNVLGKDFSMAKNPDRPDLYPYILMYKGEPFTGYDAQDNVFWYEGVPFSLAALQKAGIKVPQNIINEMKAAEANKNTAINLNSNAIRTYGYNHFISKKNATLPKTGENNSIMSLLKSLF